jgi:hypothetical protein
MTITSIRWGLAVGASLLAQITMISISIICVAVYSYTIHTGQTQEFYNEFARASGPWVSLITGGPVFFLIARWIRRRAPSAALGTAMAMAGIYLAIEIAVILAWPTNALAALPFLMVAFVPKVAGAWIGANGIASRSLAKAT